MPTRQQSPTIGALRNRIRTKQTCKMIPANLITADDAPAAFLITAKVCQAEVKFLVDTRSAIDALNVTTYRNMPIPPELYAPFYPKVFTVTNAPTGTLGQFDALLQITKGIW